MDEVSEERQYEILEELENQYFAQLDVLRGNLLTIGKEVGLHDYKDITRSVEDELVSDMEKYYEESTARAS